MAVSTIITDYIGRGTHAARPATPNVPSGASAFYYETDTTHFFGWTGSGWQQIDVGSSAGTPPTIVQSGIDSSGIASLTLGAPPTNGNLLVAMTFNPSTASPGSGWTAKDGNSSGTDFGQIFTKTAGASESATQTPLGSSPGGTGLICMWEIHGQGATPYIAGASQPETSGASNASPVFPNITNVLALGAVSLVSSPTITSFLNMTQDQLTNSGNRRGAMGHSTALTAIAGTISIFSGSGSAKSAVCLITA